MQIKIALSKGRILKQILPVMQAAGLELEEDPNESRKLVIPVKNSNISVVIVRATDAPTYVRLGAADLGIVGKDILMENGGSDLYELYDTNLAKCRLAIAQPIDSDSTQDSSKPTNKIRVATKYVNIARDYFARQGVNSDIIKLYGSMELAPLVDLSDQIIDLVDTGNTLKANGLQETQTIAHISARLVANKVSYKLKREQLAPLVQRLEDAFDALQDGV